jgi:hypothetical protein
VSEMNRREFVEATVLAALAPVVGPGAVPIVLPAELALGAASHEPGALARALAGAVRAQYGGRLSEADLAVVTRQIESVLERAEKVRRVPLANGDEPDFVFSPVRSHGTG